jgi:predicted SAM-dependent methyltransferase
VKLELGAGHRKTRGYLANDLHAFEGIDVPGKAWEIDLDDESLDEVLALGFVEHLTFYEALDTFRNVHRMLKPGGLFLFDVPDYPVWARYYLDALEGRETPVPMEHIRKTLFGWARWPGDEHKYGWDREFLIESLRTCGLWCSTNELDEFKARTHRDRFYRPEDAHIYVYAHK